MGEHEEASGELCWVVDELLLIRIRGGIQTDVHVDLFHLIDILFYLFFGLRKAFFAVSSAEHFTV